MIQEQKTFSMNDLARVVTNLCFAKEYFTEQVIFYKGLFDKEAPALVDGDLLPLSPLAELYQKLFTDFLKHKHVAEMRLNRLQGIADGTWLPNLDENQFLNNYPLER